ncbi:MAG: uL30 family ribosomal protein, partial [Candidatus Micrarchaeaceae archaeon]
MKKNLLTNKLVSIVRVRGRVNVRSDITETLNRLNLKRVNNCVVIKVTDSYGGMLNKCHNHVAYGEIDEETLSKLLAKYAPDVKAKDVLDGKYDMAKLKEIM